MTWRASLRAMAFVLALAVVWYCIAYVFLAARRSPIVPTGRDMAEINERLNAMQKELDAIGVPIEDQERIVKQARCKYLPESEGCDEEASSQGVG